VLLLIAKIDQWILASLIWMSFCLMNQRIRTYSFLLISLPISALLNAADEVVELDPYTVAGTRTSLFEAAVEDRSTMRLDRERIGEINPMGVSELLERVPGVHVDLNSRSGSVGSLYLRGGDPSFTMVLMNGVKLNDPTNSRGGSLDLSIIDPLSIEKVDVVNGAQSAIHGSEAISGVINLSTYRILDESNGAALLEAGTDGFLRGNVSFNQRYEGGTSYLNLDYIEGGDAIDGGSFEARRFGAGTAFGIGDASELHVFAFGFDADQEAFPDDSGGALFAEIRETDQRAIEALATGINYSWSAVEEFRFRVDASYYDRKESVESAGVAPGVRDPFGLPSSVSDDNLERFQLTAFGEYSISDNASLVFGWSGEREDSEGDSELIFFGFPLPGSYVFDRDTSSFFAETNLKVSERLHLQFGGRSDDVDGLDSETTFLGSAHFAMPEIGSAVRVKFGEGFKKPSVFALKNPLVGNPNLVPETSESIEISWTSEVLQGKGEIGISAFSYDFENLVDFEPGPPPQLVNRSSVKSEGGEFVFKYRAEESTTFGGYVSYVDSRDQTTDQRLRSRPSWRVGGFASKAFSDSLRGMIDAYYVSDRRESSIPTGDRFLGGYTKIDARLSWKYNDRFDVIFSLDNLLDKQYEEAVGFVAPGISGRLALKTLF